MHPAHIGAVGILEEGSRAVDGQLRGPNDTGTGCRMI